MTKAQKAKKLRELADKSGKDFFTIATENPDLAGGLEILAKERAEPSKPAKRPRASAKPTAAASRGSGSVRLENDLPTFTADYRR